MPSLIDTQTAVRRAVVEGDSALVVPWLLSGGEKRLEIHRRHYEASLAMTLLERFSATAWLVGGPFITEAARRFVREHPPASPCLAEYGAAFPRFLSARPGAERIPYLLGFAELDWALGYVSVAVDRRALTSAALGGVNPDALPEARVALQPGVRYLRAGWPIDELIKLYLTDSAPDRFPFDSGEVRLEIRGARGEFWLRRLERGPFTFRQAVSAGESIGAAAEQALKADDRFDPATALAGLFADELVVEVTL